MTNLLDNPTWKTVEAADKGLNDWCILLGYRGSVAHGMYVPNSDPNSIDDIDLMGVCVPPIDYYYGLKEYSSRGTKEITVDPYDIVVYEAKKMISLLANGNPNVLSLLWLRPEDYLKTTVAGTMLIQNRDLFMGRHIYNSFIGYAHGQLQRMTRFEHNGYMGEKRKKLVEKYGFDCKNGAHLIRLLRMGIEALQTGHLQVLRPDAQELLTIKRGALTLDDVKAMAEDLFDQCHAAKESCQLQEKPDKEAVNALCVEVISAAHQTR